MSYDVEHNALVDLILTLSALEHEYSFQPC
jgi:hypothetical protein